MAHAGKKTDVRVGHVAQGPRLVTGALIWGLLNGTQHTLLCLNAKTKQESGLWACCIESCRQDDGVSQSSEVQLQHPPESCPSVPKVACRHALQAVWPACVQAQGVLRKQSVTQHPLTAP